ncbi:MAG: PEP/pyruvate-binding domain-containing protein [Anaerolineales bacterium]|nr:PEP/pyruvate-binding domain-containing protein [Anaerolineales bacterium]
MTFDMRRLPKVLEVFLELQQYPILSRSIRDQMRQELFARGVITLERFEAEIEQKAIESQRREGITDPLYEDSAADWAERVRVIRDHLTDFYFAHNLPHDLFKETVGKAINQVRPGQEVILSFNPELAPWDLLFAQAERWKALPPEEQATFKHHLQEFVVVLIKGMISDQLAFVGIARNYFTMDDLREIRRRRIGRGKIGGKAAGLLLAWKILQKEAGTVDGLDVQRQVTIPESYYLGADAFYDFMSLNNLHEFMNQKYRDLEEIEESYARVQAAYGAGRLPKSVARGLRKILETVGDAPLIVRSSSLLEDNFGYSFSGKYESYFCPNQGTLEENLEALQNAVCRVYASVLSPDALFYRLHRGLLDYDERMAVLIQKVIGQRRGDFFFPTLAGVGFSRNPHRWSPRIRSEDGFLRLVLGMGTRAVDRVANDYPRVIALSHPTLRPEVMPQQIKRYSQHFVDLIDLPANQFKTVPLEKALAVRIPALRYLALVDEGDHLRPMITGRSEVPAEKLVLTFDQLLRNTSFVSLLKNTLGLLETHYGRPVDVEFAVDVDYHHPEVQFTLCLLQCRPLSRREESERHQIPTGIRQKDILFSANHMVPNGAVRRIEYIVYIDPNRYAGISSHSTRLALARVVGRLNKLLENHTFILMGPGRWGTSNIELGVKVTYADIYNCRALIEIAMPRDGGRVEVSYGTHFFQDLVEADIYPLALYPGEPDVVFDAAFLNGAENQLLSLLPADASYARYVHVIHIPSAALGRYLNLVMNTDREKAIAYLE